VGLFARINKTFLAMWFIKDLKTHLINERRSVVSFNKLLHKNLLREGIESEKRVMVNKHNSLAVKANNL
jgi:hypothetical protein